MIYSKKIKLAVFFRRYFFILIIISFILGNPFTFPKKTQAQTTFQETLVTSGVSAPTAMEFAPDGRLFVAEQSGHLRVIKNGALLPEDFVTLSVASNSERGLLGIAFDPNFSTNRFIYLYYTRQTAPIKNRVSRFIASATNPDVVEPGSETIILDNIASDAGNHNGGAIHFGLDSKLYVAVGDGGTTHTNSQLLSSLSGKLLRINSDGSIPSDNPFVGTSGARGEIWALGLRNPYTFAVDPTSGKIYINDVGENNWEEIDLSAKGANYGWPTCEGVCSNQGFINPIYAYSHSVGQAITGGTFYRSSQFPSQYLGSYFFSDYLGGFIKRLDTSNAVSDFWNPQNGPVDLKVGPDGFLYYLSIFDGAVYKIGASSPTLSNVATVSSSIYSVGASTISNVPSGTSKADFLAALTKNETHQTWNETGITDPVATGNTLLVTAEDGTTVVTYTVSVNTTPPATLSSITITTPATKLTYTVGNALDITGLVVTGTYSDATTKVETISAANVTGFDSSSPATGRILTITVGDKTTTYTINVTAAPTVLPHKSHGGGGGGGRNSSAAPTETLIPLLPSTGGDCVGNVSFSALTGLPCANQMSQQMAIPGCNNRTIGFSIVTGQSCANNIVTSAITRNFGLTTLRQGSLGEAVKELQKFLNQTLNIGLVVDGKLGPKTITFVKKWQSEHGLVADGLVGPKTKAKMNAEAQ